MTVSKTQNYLYIQDGVIQQHLGTHGANDPAPASLRALRDKADECYRNLKVGSQPLLRTQTGDDLLKKIDIINAKIDSYNGKVQRICFGSLFIMNKIELDQEDVHTPVLTAPDELAAPVDHELRELERRSPFIIEVEYIDALGRVSESDSKRIKKAMLEQSTATSYIMNLDKDCFLKKGDRISNSINYDSGSKSFYINKSRQRVELNEGKCILYSHRDQGAEITLNISRK
jgi:hypothetical protein